MGFGKPSAYTNGSESKSYKVVALKEYERDNLILTLL